LSFQESSWFFQETNGPILTELHQPGGVDDQRSPAVTQNRGPENAGDLLEMCLQALNDYLLLTE
jgi:hypothetical protein